MPASHLSFDPRCILLSQRIQQLGLHTTYRRGLPAYTKLPEKAFPLEIRHAHTRPQLQLVAGLLENFPDKINKRFSPNSLREKYPKCVYWQWLFSLPDRVGRNFSIWNLTSIWDTTLETQLGNSKYHLLELSFLFLFLPPLSPPKSTTQTILFSTLCCRHFKWKARSYAFGEGRESQQLPMVLVYWIVLRMLLKTLERKSLPLPLIYRWWNGGPGMQNESLKTIQQVHGKDRHLLRAIQ